MAEDVNDFGGRLDGLVGAIEAVGGFLHGLNAGTDFFAGTIGDVEKDFSGVRDALDGSDHLVDGSGSFGNARGLHLSVLDDVLHVDAHFVHGAGDFFDGRGGLHADFGGFVGGDSNLAGASGNLTGGIAGGTDETLQAMGHAQESVPEGVALGTRNDFHAEIAFGDGHGDGGHFFQIGDHVVEGGGQCAEFIGAMDIDILVEITGVADLAGDADEVL